MLKLRYCGLAVGLFWAASANAITGQAQVGDEFTHLNVGVGTETSGLYSQGSWDHSDDKGDVYGLGVGLNIPLGPFMASVEGEGLYLKQKADGHRDGSDDDGYAGAVGGGLTLPIGEHFSLYGSAHYAPDSLSNSIGDYKEASGGLRWNVMRPVNVDVGYRYVELSGTDGKRDNAVADGVYVGAGIGF